MLPDVSIRKMMYSLSTGMPPTLYSLDRRPVVGEQAPHLFGQALLRGREPVLLGSQRRVLDARALARGFARAGLAAPRCGSCRCAGRSVVVVSCAAHALRLADDLVELLLVLRDEALEIALALLEPRGLARARITMNSRMIAPNPQQIASRNDMLNISNSRRRFMASPPTARASSRPCAATAASTPARLAGSPSIGNRITLIGTPTGSCRTARLK